MLSNGAVHGPETTLSNGAVYGPDLTLSLPQKCCEISLVSTVTTSERGC